MSWFVPTSFTVGQVLRALDMNNLNSDFNWLYNGGLTPIYDTTLSGSVASIDITSIPATWAHLLLKTYLRSDKAATIADGGLFRFNNDSGANYNQQLLQASNTSTAGTVGNPGATAGRYGIEPAASATANRFAAGVLFVPHYAGSSNHKTAISLTSASADDTAGNQYVEINGTTWKNTAALTRITLLPNGGANFISGSRATLYGVGVPT